MTQPDHYGTLGVLPWATDEEIREAYHLRAKANHPDRGGSNEVMVAVNAAYEVLSDAGKRTAYDAERSERFREILTAAVPTERAAAPFAIQPSAPEVDLSWKGIGKTVARVGLAAILCQSEAGRTVVRDKFPEFRDMADAYAEQQEKRRRREPRGSRRTVPSWGDWRT